MKFWVNNSNKLQNISDYIIQLLKKKPVALFYGKMGAGKTTLIKSIVNSLQSNDTVSSPTFSIVNEYLYPEGKIFHFDLYRIASEAELHAIGFDDYLFSGEICLIEWPEHAGTLLEGVSHIRINIRQEGTNRIIELEENV
jgi:tRNA threonylcarbamoyladenosine biosynthesis protein TsaE